MKRLAAILLVASLAACSLGKTGGRGPQIQRPAPVETLHEDAAAQRELDLGQR